jgi:hypothetical protein
MPLDQDHDSKTFNVVGTATFGPTASTRSRAARSFGADMTAPGMLWGASCAARMPMRGSSPSTPPRPRRMEGVKAVVTSGFPGPPSDWRTARIGPMSRQRAWPARRRSMTAMPSPPSPRRTARIAKPALKLIEVEYEVLPHVIDVDAAMAEDAPLMHDHIRTGRRGRAPEEAPTSPSATSSAMAMSSGLRRGRRHHRAHYKTEPAHQGYIEPHACLANVGATMARRDVGLHPGPLHGPRHLRRICWAWTSQSCASPRRRSAAALAARPRSSSSPWRWRCRARQGRPVKMVMSRDEVLRATGPTASSVDRREDRHDQGRHGSPRAMPSCAIRAGPSPARRWTWRHVGLCPYDLENVQTVSAGTS